MFKQSKDHLHCVNETYFQHMVFAFKIAMTLILSSILVAVHALIPAMFPCSASKRILNLADEIRARQNCNQK